MKMTACLALAASIVAPAALADDCRYSKDIDLEFDPDDVARLIVEVDSGYLNVRGADRGSQLVIRGRACADDRDKLDGMDLVTDLRGSDLEVRMEAESNTGSLNFSLFNMSWSSYAFIDIDIEVPAGMTLEIDDGSGSIDIRDTVGELSIDDGSGSISISGVAGNVDIRDGSGGIEVRDVTGSVRVDDGSGSISIREVSGDVEIPDDGSGSIDISNVGGSVRIDDDGSGSIDVYDVEGDFIARSTGSGGVDYGRIGGRVDVRD